MKKPKNLCKDDEYKEIFETINQISENKKIKIILTPGNHEISIWGNQDTRFRKRKNSLITKLRKSLRRNAISEDFLKENLFCQYIILDNNINNELKISLYDSKLQILREEPIFEEILKQTFEIKFKSLLCHGHQCDPIEDIASPWWSLGIYTPKIIKQIGNIIWNGLIKGGIISNWLYRKRIRNTLLDNKLNVDESSERKLTILSIYSIELKKGKESELLEFIEAKFIDNIVDFVEKINKDLKKFGNNKFPITHFIYGHTHETSRDLLAGLSILNSGSWQRYEEFPVIIRVCNRNDGFHRYKFFIPQKLLLFNQIIHVISQLVINLGKLILHKDRIKRYNFTTSEILQKSRINNEIDDKEYDLLKYYYDLKIVNISLIDFQTFINQIKPIYLRIYNKIKTLQKKST